MNCGICHESEIEELCRKCAMKLKIRREMTEDEEWCKAADEYLSIQASLVNK